MRRFVYGLVERLGEPDSGLSRNRHFSAFSSPSGQRALRLHRHLVSLADTVEKHRDEAKVGIERTGDGMVVQIEVPSIKLRRTATLTADDARILHARGGTLAALLARNDRGDAS